MSSQLKNTLSFINLLPGAVVVLPHNLNTGGVTRTPDIIFVPSEDLSVTADSTSVTLTNTGSITLSGTILVEFWHSIERAFGAAVVQDLPVKPYIVVSTEGGNQPPQPPFVRGQVVTIYARPTGDDTAGTGVLSNPYRTFQRAIRDVPSIIPPIVEYVVDITGIGVETLPPNYALPVILSAEDPARNAPDGGPFKFIASLNIRAFPKLLALPAAQATIAAADIVSVLADPDSGLVAITVAGIRSSWAASALKGKHLIRTAGGDPGTADSTCVIYDSDDNGGAGPSTIRLCNLITWMPGAAGLGTGQYQIVEPSATLEGSVVDFRGDNSALRCLNVSSLAIQGVRVRAVGGNPDFLTGICTDDCNPFFELCDFPHGCEIRGAEYQFGGFSSVFGNGDSEPAIMVGEGCWYSTRRALVWGIIFSALDGITDLGVCVVDSCTPFGAGGFYNTSSPNAHIHLQHMLIVDALSHGIDAVGGDWNLQFTKIENSQGGGVRASQDAFVTMSRVVGSGNGAGGAGFGVRAYDGSGVRLADTVSPFNGQIALANETTVTGVDGDMKIGNLAMRTWVNFYTVAPINNEYDLVVPPVGDAAAYPVGVSGGTSGSRLFLRV